MMHEGLALLVLGVSFATVVSTAGMRGSTVTEVVTEKPAAESCDSEALANEFEQRAERDEAAAERYRTWADAERRIGSTAYGKRYAARYYDEQARKVDEAAERSRFLAEWYRNVSRSEADETASCGEDAADDS